MLRGFDTGPADPGVTGGWGGIGYPPTLFGLDMSKTFFLNNYVLLMAHPKFLTFLRAYDGQNICKISTLTIIKEKLTPSESRL